ncbi:MAG TPA: hypothetical protein VMD59_23300, partial [Acidimicrobiales bacterium]|nr:hypothetical protein [Acidimicrobiales bacterium]
MREVVRTAPRTFAKSWLPQANFDELMIRADRDPIHMHPALNHLHYHWNMDDILPSPQKPRQRGFK